MSSQDRQARYSSWQIRLYLASIVILVLGLAGAVVIYAMAPEKDRAELIYGVSNDPRYTLELQRIGGNAEVAMAGLHQWFDGLWHGKPLAYTVAVLCAAVAALCFWAGHTRIFEPLPDETDQIDQTDDRDR
jgi:hypothetical protein